MRCLLDTHALIWLLQKDQSLSEGAREAIADADSVYVSLVSLWEIAIKISLGKLTVPYSPGKELRDLMEEAGLQILPVDAGDLDRIVELPFHHRDPFDRMLAVQALSRNLRFLSRDPAFDAYGVERAW